MRIAEGYYLIVYAALVMVMMAFCPTGILGLVDRLAKAAMPNGRSAPAIGAERTAP
jgi:branched-chain amino acid transport system permease protein